MRSIISYLGVKEVLGDAVGEGVGDDVANLVEVAGGELTSALAEVDLSGAENLQYKQTVDKYVSVWGRQGAARRRKRPSRAGDGSQRGKARCPRHGAKNKDEDAQIDECIPTGCTCDKRWQWAARGRNPEPPVALGNVCTTRRVIQTINGDDNKS